MVKKNLWYKENIETDERNVVGVLSSRFLKMKQNQNEKSEYFQQTKILTKNRSCASLNLKTFTTNREFRENSLFARLFTTSDNFSNLNSSILQEDTILFNSCRAESTRTGEYRCNNLPFKDNQSSLNCLFDAIFAR